MRKHPLTIRTRHNVVRGNWLFEEIESLAFDHEVCPAVRAVVAQGDEALRRVNVNAVLVVGEMRPACSARGQDQVGAAAVGGNPDEVGVPRLPAVEGTVFAVISIAAQQNNFRAIGRPRGIAVHGKRLRQLHRCSASCGNFPELPAVAGPGHISDGLAIRRPSGLKFAAVCGGEPLGPAAGQVHGEEVRHGGENEFFPVRRFGWIHDQPHLHRPLFDRLRKIQLGPQFLGDLGREGNYFLRAGDQIEAFDFAILVVNDFLAAWEKRITGENVASEERFLIVAGDWILHPTVFSAFEIAQTQSRLRLVARDVEDLLAIRREHGAKSALDLVNEVVFVAGLAVAAGDVPRRELLVVV